MSRIQITNAEGNAMSGYGTAIKLDGQEVRSVRAIDVRIGCDEITTATIEIIGEDSVEIDIPADVTLKTVHSNECVKCGLDSRVMPMLGVRSFTQSVCKSHMASPGRHRQWEPGERYALVRVPLFVADAVDFFRSLFPLKVKA